MVLGLIFAVVLAKGSVLKAIAMILIGLLLSMVGSDLETGAERMTFGMPELADGIGFVVVAMGVFGFAEIMRNLESDRNIATSSQAKVTGLMPTLAGSQGLCRRDRARHGHRLAARHPARRRRGDRGVRRLHVREEDVQGSGALRHAARSRAWRRRKAPTTPRRRPRSSRC